MKILFIALIFSSLAYSSEQEPNENFEKIAKEQQSMRESFFKCAQEAGIDQRKKPTGLEKENFEKCLINKKIKRISQDK